MALDDYQAVCHFKNEDLQCSVTMTIESSTHA